MGHKDVKAGETWPTCRACAEAVAKAKPPVYGPVNPYEFVLYEDDEPSM